MLQDPVLLNDWHPVARASDLDARNPIGTRLLGEDIVIWRSGDGDDVVIHAWQDLCIHRGTRLSIGKVQEDCLACPYHGWTYDTNGHCIHIPAHPGQPPPTKARVRTYSAKIAYGLVWVTLGQPTNNVPLFEEGHDPSFRKTICGPYPINAAGPRIVENFLDVGHFPFVHEGILGDKAHPEIAEYDAEINERGVVATGIRVYQPDGFGTGQGDYVTYTYKALRPLTAYLTKVTEGPTLSILLAVQPHAQTESTAWMVMAMNYNHDTAEADLVAFQDRIFWQDGPILRSQRPELLPLDLQAELHLRSDRTAIAYRKWLNQLGLSFGTS
jgi:phenylpropionate dioxygenase-like ring-hydroxylating dioxygenase large terminal subunit